jgi:hypothetical protein
MRDKGQIRNSVSCRKETISGLFRSIGILNLFYFLYVLFHLIIITQVFHNGWIFFLWPVIMVLWGLVNIIFLSCYLLALLIHTLSGSRTDRGRYASSVRKALFILCVLIVAIFSIYHILNQ